MSPSIAGSSRLLFAAVATVLAACSMPSPESAPASRASAPVARSNWAVAQIGTEAIMFYGLGAGKTYLDVATDVHAFDTSTGVWRSLGSIPVESGRLASAAATIHGRAYLFGGYTVAADGSEKSAPEVLRFDPVTAHFERVGEMPVAVDDSVALAWRDRWIVLVSGWHDTGNVSDVQLFDTQTMSWITGTPWPGQPVFGHAGGLVDDSMVICDGVVATKDDNGKNRFEINDMCWQGDLDSAFPGQIKWHQLSAHPGRPLYRSGSVGVNEAARARRVVFAGGSSRPYNYNGIGYDGVPAEPSSAVFSFNLDENAWVEHVPMAVAGMDYRGLVAVDSKLYLFGGMRQNQEVSAEVIQFRLQAVQ